MSALASHFTLEAETHVDNNDKNHGRWRRCWPSCGRFVLRACCLVCLAIVLFLMTLHENLKMYMGMPVFDPSFVQNNTVTVIHDSCRNVEIHPSHHVSVTHKSNTSTTLPNSHHTIPCFNTSSPLNDKGVNPFSLSREWTVLRDSTCINTSHLDANVCVKQHSSTSTGGTGSDVVTCLPSFMIIGFEKCSTTQLLLWLSYHPNLLGKWQETRFFSTVPTKESLQDKWRGYLKEQVPTPGGLSGVGKYWNYEKTPSSILSTQVANYVNMVTPQTRLIIMIRDPTPRALSAFVMYTRHINNYNEFSATWNIDKVMYSSLVIRNTNTGEVKFAKKGGVGGDVATGDQLKRSDRTDGPWRYISFPPTAKDFHDFLLTNRNISEKHGQFHYNSRESRVIQEGFYSKYMTNWLEVFPTHQFLVIPMESLWNKNTIENLNSLQMKLGIPVFDYKKVTYVDSETKRYELKSASTYFLWKMFNTGNNVIKMLPESKKYLDGLYCESNQQLKRMLPGATLKGYSCT